MRLKSAGFAFVLAVLAFFAPAAAMAESAEGPHPEFEYLQLDPLVLPIINERGITQQVSLIVSIETPWGKSTELKPWQPRLADAYIQDLYGVLGAGHGIAPGGVIDVRMLKERLTQVTQKVLGPEKFNDVLLQVVQQRQL